MKQRIIRDAVFVIISLALVLLFLNIRFPWLKAHGDEQTELPTAQLKMSDDSHHKTITVELAETDAQQEKGLSFRSSLAPDSGMLFLMPEAGPQRFWMYGMNFSLDMVFIRNGKVVDYEEDVPPPSETQNNPSVVTSLEEADSVLEINAGKAKEWNIGIGTRVEVEK